MSTIKNLSKSVTPNKSDELNTLQGRISPELKRIMDEECKLVKGRFKNYESPGGALPFTAGKYPGQPIYNKTFQDGEVYEVPLWVARWLNGIDAIAKGVNGKIGSCSYPIHGFKWDAGKPPPESQIGSSGDLIPIIGIAKRKKRYGFESLEFDSDVA